MKIPILKSKVSTHAIVMCLFSAYCMGVPANVNADDLRETEVMQQQISVSGVVADTQGNPVIGASVIVENTSNGTITDLNGEFRLSVPSGAMLKITFIGYKDVLIKASATEKLKVVLQEDTKTLDEVVVVGFGTQKKVNLTGSVAVVGQEEIASRPVSTATQALQGLVPGLQISTSNGSLESSSSINIRGTGTIGQGSSGSPLILIDGMEGDINTLNPQDIENISVLKDAAASSIYGSRAPFGVILITTKSGGKGKTSISYNNSFRWNSPVLKPEMMDSYSFASYFNLANMNGGAGVFFDDEHMQRIKDYQAGILTTQIIPDGDKWANGYNEGNANNDWYDIYYKDFAFSQEHNVTVNGGAEQFNYYVSLGYLGQDGLLDVGKERMSRYNLAVKLNANLTSWLKMRYAMRFVRKNNDRPSDLTNTFYYNLARQGWPTFPMYDPNGYLYAVDHLPYALLKDGGESQIQADDASHQLALILEPIKNWQTHIELNYRIFDQDWHWDQQVIYAYDVHGNPYPAPQRLDSRVYEEHRKDNYWNINVYTDYTYTLNEKHNFHGLLGFQAEELNKKGFDLTTYGIIVPELPDVDITTGLDNKGNPISPTVGGSRASWSTAGFFARFNYDYEGKYLAEVNLRYDGTSRFRRDQRWNLFPSFSLGWNIARENFWEPLSDKVNSLKLRFSYGELGNQNTTNWYQTYQVINVNAASGTWLQGGLKPTIAFAPNLVSTSLGWETIRTYNVGLDFGLFNNRLRGSFDYFIRNTNDMVGNAPELPNILGTAGPVTNNTDLRTQGWELELGWNDRLNNGLGYSVRMTLSDAKTKITHYPNNPTNAIGQTLEGHELGEIWGYETIGIAKTQEEMDAHLSSLPNGGQDALGTNWSAGDIMYADLNGDGKISAGGSTLADPGDKKVIGNETPRYLFGLDLSADWKGFDFRAFFQGVLKRDYWQGSYYFWGAYNGIWGSTGLVEHKDFFLAEPYEAFEANTEAYYPRPLFAEGKKNRETQTRYLQDASYIRLKNLQLGYTLPSSLTQKIGIQKLRLYVSGENLLTFTNMVNMFDPETVDGGDDNGNAYPLSRTISVGVNLTF